MNDKIRQEAMHLHNWCEGQCDCTHCDFGRDNRTCEISGIPAQWFGTEEDHSADVGKKVKTRQSEFLKMFPRVGMTADGTIAFCPENMDSTFVCPIRERDCYDPECGDCRRKYWLEEVEDNGD